jgi:hypothetical protein
MNGFKFIIKSKCCSFYDNDVYYGSGRYTNGLHIPNLEMSMFNISSKMNKLDKKISILFMALQTISYQRNKNHHVI